MSKRQRRPKLASAGACSRGPGSEGMRAVPAGAPRGPSGCRLVAVRTCYGSACFYVQISDFMCGSAGRAILCAKPVRDVGAQPVVDLGDEAGGWETAGFGHKRRAGASPCWAPCAVTNRCFYKLKNKTIA